MIDLMASQIVWPGELQPIRPNEYEKEPFQSWWHRCKDKLGHLPHKVCEQWVYRHWEETGYGFLPLENLSCRLEQWETGRILASIGIWDEGLITDEGHKYCSASWDYDVVREKGGEPLETMEKTGTWNIPIIVLQSDSGFGTFRGPRPDIHYWLIEGHKRIRCLNALAHYSKPASNHLLYVLDLKIDSHRS
jgi:hypothetical protein